MRNPVTELLSSVVSDEEANMHPRLCLRIGNLVKLVETPEEAFEVFDELQPLFSQHQFELKN